MALKNPVKEVKTFLKQSEGAQLMKKHGLRRSLGLIQRVGVERDLPNLIAMHERGLKGIMKPAGDIIIQIGLSNEPNFIHSVAEWNASKKAETKLKEFAKALATRFDLQHRHRRNQPTHYI